MINIISDKTSFCPDTDQEHYSILGFFLNKKEPSNYISKSIYMLSLDKEFIKYLVYHLKILLFEMSGM